MTDLNTNNLFAVVVPIDAKDFKIVSSLRNPSVAIDCFNSTLLYTFAKDHQGYEHLDGLGIHSKQKIEIIGLFNELPEEQARGLVENRVYEDDGGNVIHHVFKNYHSSNPHSGLGTSLLSLKSLLESKGLNPSRENILIILKAE